MQTPKLLKNAIDSFMLSSEMYPKTEILLFALRTNEKNMQF